jgi:hypothetical protein
MALSRIRDPVLLRDSAQVRNELNRESLLRRIRSIEQESIAGRMRAI